MLGAVILVCMAVVMPSVWARTCVCVTTSDGSGLNMRTCPSTSCEIITNIADGYCADYISTDGSWLLVDYEQWTGYVHGGYVSGPSFCGGHGDYCTAHLCSSYLNGNQLRGCDPQGCGHYGASRGSGTHGGTDIRCDGGDIAYAPFPGTLIRKAPPYGDGSCCDVGYLLEGTGIWAGYEVKIFYTDPDDELIGQQLAQGQRIGIHVGLHCGCYTTSMIDHAHFEFYFNGDIIDGTSWVMCH